jgi:CheY-like chemotaxis protein
VRVLVADDQSLVRSGLRMIIDHQDGLEVVAEAADGAQAVAAALGHRPDVILLDVRMPTVDGVEADRSPFGRLRGGGQRQDRAGEAVDSLLSTTKRSSRASRRAA